MFQFYSNSETQFFQGRTKFWKFEENDEGHLIKKEFPLKYFHSKIKVHKYESLS